MSEPQVVSTETLDTNNDGVADTVEYDLSSTGNGQVDEVVYGEDTNQDGKVEQVEDLKDTDHDGVLDTDVIYEDPNEDGKVDEMIVAQDTNHDGVVDTAEVVDYNADGSVASDTHYTDSSESGNWQQVS